MDQIRVSQRLRHASRLASLLAAAPLLALTLSGCLVAGVSSRGGGFIWPGGLGLLFMLAILFFFLRGRR